MVNARAAKAHALIGHICVVRQFIRSQDDRMAEADYLQRGGTQGGQRHSRQRIGIVYHQRARAEFLNVAANGQPGGCSTQILEEPTRPARVGDTLIHPIFQRDGVIILDIRQPTDFDHIDHIVTTG